MSTVDQRTASPEACVQSIIAARRAVPPPRATYRLQFNATFTFAHALRIVPYLEQLGISHVYASPIFKAAPGSMHGYNVVDFNEVNPEIGTRDELEALAAELHRRSMGLILDFVPNHMGIEEGANAWWQDVIENGRMSRFAEYFDIDWTPLKRELQGKVLLPFLGDQYGAVLERGELQLAFEESGFTLRYWETPFPIDPRTWPFVLTPVLDGLRQTLEADNLDLLELESVANALERLPQPVEFQQPSHEDIEARYREQVVTRLRLAALMERSDTIADAVGREVARLNGSADDPRSFDRLDHLLSLQPYRLASWRVAAEEINYRRFFAINTLAAIRQEEPEVFAATHALLVDLLASGVANGVRFDHPDGLWDPEAYFRDVQAAVLRESARRELDIDDDAWTDDLRAKVDAAIAAELDRIAASDRRWPVYAVAEKIVEHGEDIPKTWEIAGTVGYEFARDLTGAQVDTANRKAFDTIFGRFTGDRIRFNELVHEMKQRMMRDAFPSEVNVLTNVLNRISEHDRHSRDFTLNNLRAALREVIAWFPVYRTYTTCDELGVEARDRRIITDAVGSARRRSPNVDPTVFDFLESVLLLHATDNPRERLNVRCHFAMKMQQLSGPVMAKGLEDTTFYRFNRLVSLNEVGGDPARFGCMVGEVHRSNRSRLDHWPHAMLTSSTHDTKRSEDVRARINVLSGIPAEWRAALNRWSRMNRRHKTKIEGALAPHRADEYVIYQTLIGTWSLSGIDGVDGAYIDRIREYMIKVVREAIRFSNWVNPNEEYEAALTGFVEGVLDPKRGASFLEDLQQFVDRWIDIGLVNALSQQVIKLTSPGVPDLYQGTEVWDDSLVDPDNRRPVDFDCRSALLSASKGTSMADLWADRRTGAVKQAATARILGYRRRHPELFDQAAYEPIEVDGDAARHVIAFRRTHGDGKLIVIAAVGIDPDDAALADCSLELGNGVCLDVLSDMQPVTISRTVAEILGGVPVRVLAVDNPHGEGRTA